MENHSKSEAPRTHIISTGAGTNEHLQGKNPKKWESTCCDQGNLSYLSAVPAGTKDRHAKCCQECLKWPQFHRYFRLFQILKNFQACITPAEKSDFPERASSANCRVLKKPAISLVWCFCGTHCKIPDFYPLTWYVSLPFRNISQIPHQISRRKQICARSVRSATLRA